MIKFKFYAQAIVPMLIVIAFCMMTIIFINQGRSAVLCGFLAILSFYVMTVLTPARLKWWYYGFPAEDFPFNRGMLGPDDSAWAKNKLKVFLGELIPLFVAQEDFEKKIKYYESDTYFFKNFHKSPEKRKARLTIGTFNGTKIHSLEQQLNTITAKINRLKKRPKKVFSLFQSLGFFSNERFTFKDFVGQLKNEEQKRQAKNLPKSNLQFRRTWEKGTVVYFVSGHLCHDAKGHDEFISDLAYALEHYVSRVVVVCKDVSYFRIDTAKEILRLVNEKNARLEFCEARTNGAHRFNCEQNGAVLQNLSYALKNVAEPLKKVGQNNG